MTRRRVGPAVEYTKHPVLSGPLKGKTLLLEKNGDGRTLPLVINGQAGRYLGGHWEPAK